MAGSGAAWKVLGSGGAIAAGVVANKVLHVGWKAATGKQPPTIPEDPETDWKEAVAWAVLSGALIGVAKLLATRQAARYMARSTGRLPAEIKR